MSRNVWRNLKEGDKYLLSFLKRVVSHARLPPNLSTFGRGGVVVPIAWSGASSQVLAPPYLAAPVCICPRAASFSSSQLLVQVQRPPRPQLPFHVHQQARRDLHTIWPQDRHNNPTVFQCAPKQTLNGQCDLKRQPRMRST